MSKATIRLVSSKSKRPCKAAELVSEGRRYINTGQPITHWEVEVLSIPDLAVLSAEVGYPLVLTFEGYDVSDILIYDDYME